MKHLPPLLLLLLSAAAARGDDWAQLQGNACRSGNAPAAQVKTPLGLVGAVPLTDGIYAAPVVADGKVFVVDGSGVVVAFDALTLKEVWKFATKGGAGNCNNVAAPAVLGKYVHVGTTAGYYYVLDRDTGKVVREIDCQEPIFSAPAAGTDRVYFATLGARVFAVEAGRRTGLDLGLRQGGHQVRRRPLERRGLVEGPQGPRHLEGSLRLLARHLPDRQDRRDSGRRSHRLSRRRRRRAAAARRRRDSRLRRRRISGHVRPERRRGRQRLRPVAPPRQRGPGRNPASSPTTRCRRISSRGPRRRSTCPVC